MQAPYAEKLEKPGKTIKSLRAIVGLSQAEFAKLIGQSIHAVISLENDRNALTHAQASRIGVSTGANRSALLKGRLQNADGSKFTPKDFAQWMKRFQARKQKELTRNFARWLDVLFEAARRGDKVPVTYLSIRDWLREAPRTLGLEREVGAVLRERGLFTLISTVGGMRANPREAERCGFVDDPRLKDSDQVESLVWEDFEPVLGFPLT